MAEYIPTPFGDIEILPNGDWLCDSPMAGEAYDWADRAEKKDHDMMNDLLKLVDPFAT